MVHYQTNIVLILPGPQHKGAPMESMAQHRPIESLEAVTSVDSGLIAGAPGSLIPVLSTKPASVRGLGIRHEGRRCIWIMIGLPEFYLLND